MSISAMVFEHLHKLCDFQLCAFCVTWAALFLAVRYVYPNRSADFSNRVVSLVHAAVVIPLAVYTLRGRQPLLEFGQPTRAEEVRLCC